MAFNLNWASYHQQKSESMHFHSKSLPYLLSCQVKDWLKSAGMRNDGNTSPQEDPKACETLTFFHNVADCISEAGTRCGCKAEAGAPAAPLFN